MKSKKHIQWITALGLIVIFALQAIWLHNTYMLIKNDMYKECCAILDKALYEEMNIICNQLPKGTTIKGGPENDSISFNTYLFDGIWEIGLQYSVNRIDSLAGAYLRTADIDGDFIICTVDPKTKDVLKQSAAQVIPTWGIIKSEIIPTRLNHSEGMQLILVNPYLVIFERMGLLIIATALMAFFVVGCIVYQVRIISNQNRIAKVREDFSYAMIHDMKTPLSSIMMTLNFLHSGKLDDKVEIKKRYFNIAKSETEHLLALTNKVLTLSKLESQTLTMVTKEVLLAPIIEKLIENFSVKSTKPTLFTTELNAKTAYADEEYLSEVISNLIDNSIKYSKESVKIKISSSSNDLFTTIKVHDNGLGIEEKYKRSIFNKFERAAASKRSHKGGATGFGLGLSFVQQVVAAHGGDIAVNSIEGKFTEFVINLPLIINKL